ncbi:MAG: arsenate reductase (azurin) small subunit [Candidatus Lambdaproteobacteria bacterium]|nr:arsenate reductase (azurin) small subunit [Candidatus Lambdaproteobacteria bacterium]
MRQENDRQTGPDRCLVSRRGFLLSSAAALATMTVLLRVPGLAQAQPARLVRYPRKKIGTLSGLAVDQPVAFAYPDDGAHAQSLLVRLGVPAGGGIGPQQDVVAFNSVCTHQGGPLGASYKPATKTLGACVFHLSTFDLTRHGILVSGQAYQSLPQVLLELHGDDIHAVGMMGLIFGRHDNLQS